MKNYLVGITEEKNTANEVSLTLLRVFVGLTLALTHGIGKVPPPQMMVDGLASMGFPCPSCFAWAAGLAEFVGGLFLAFGLFTRPAAGFVAFTMAVAAFLAHAQDPFAKKELALFYLVTSLVFAVRGAGKYSLDRVIVTKFGKS